MEEASSTFLLQNETSFSGNSIVLDVHPEELQQHLEGRFLFSVWMRREKVRSEEREQILCYSDDTSGSRRPCDFLVISLVRANLHLNVSVKLCNSKVFPLDCFSSSLWWFSFLLDIRNHEETFDVVRRGLQDVLRAEEDRTRRGEGRVPVGVERPRTLQGRVAPLCPDFCQFGNVLR